MSEQREAYIIDAVRTPVGRYAGALKDVRPDDLAAVAIRALVERTGVDVRRIEDVILGCSNQSGEDNRNVARMALLLAGLPVDVAGCTVNRLCGSGLQAVNDATRAIKLGEGDVFIAGGVESMTRAPYVLSKAAKPFARDMELFDTSLGWRFVNPKMKAMYGTDSMGQTAENVAEKYGIKRDDQDAFAVRSQRKAAAAQTAKRFDREIVAVEIPQKKGDPKKFDRDEFVRGDTTPEILARLKPAFRTDGAGSVTAGNSSGLNDGAAALLIASDDAVKRFGFKPRARVLAAAVAGVEPRLMGMGPVPASKLALERAGKKLADMDVIELNEAFAAQSLACLREMGLADDDARVNPNGGAIALGHPLGMSGARLVLTAVNELELKNKRYALATMCIGVGQGMAMVIERV